MSFSLKFCSIFLWSVASCAKTLAFTQPNWNHRCFKQRQRQRQQFSYDPNTEEGFESLVEAATSGSTEICGGDFAGLVATFNPSDGTFIPIPEYLVPSELLEWGQEPKCLEVLLSEDIYNDENDDEYVMNRVTTTILPDTGCGIDNLETKLARDEIDLESQWKSNDENIVGLQYPLGEDTLRVETIFGLESEVGVDRIRVAIDLIPSEEDFTIKSPMMLTLERRTSLISSGGTIAEGGGLDGRTVYMLLGERLRGSSTFVDGPSMSYDNPAPHNYDRDNDIRHVDLPANISIAYGWLKDEKSWILQVSYITHGTRRVMSRQFTIANDGELDFEMRSWVEELT